MITTPDGVNIYTDTDVQEKVAEAKTIAADESKRTWNIHVSNVVQTTFKSEVREGSMEEDYAVGLYNNLAGQLDWPVVDSLSVKYRATVTIFGDEVFTIENIEADDEESARQQVWDDLNFDDISIRFTATALSESGIYRGDGGWTDFADIFSDNTEVEVEEMED